MNTIDQGIYARIHECVVSREQELREAQNREERVDIIVASIQHYSDLPASELRSIASKIVNDEFSPESREDIRWTRYFVTSIVSILIVYLVIQVFS